MIAKSSKLNDVCYDIRGPILREAKRLEEEGYKILKLNIGNPAPFGFDAPDEIIHDIVVNLRQAQGYCDSKGLFPARKAIMQYYQAMGIHDIDTEDIFVGNGVSELIVMAMQGLLEAGDEMLIPAPDYPLWTAAVTLCGGRPVHYLCDESNEWRPDLDDIAAKVTSRTRGIVVINPNNPTGAVYDREVLEGIARVAEKHGLIIFADEIYEKITYDDAQHVAMATLSGASLCVTFSGLSKAYRAAGFRAGWMFLCGDRASADGYMDGLEMLSNMRLCSNVPAQFAIQTALGGYQSISDLVLPGGRLREQRDYCYERLSAVPGVSCVRPRGALYLFPKLDTKRFGIEDDEQFVMDLLREEKVLVVHGRGFNWPEPDHFRIVFLPQREDLELAADRIERLLHRYEHRR
jgi:alanine-synthesizing transaminase